MIVDNLQFEDLDNRMLEQHQRPYRQQNELISIPFYGIKIEVIKKIRKNHRINIENTCDCDINIKPKPIR